MGIPVDSAMLYGNDGASKERIDRLKNEFVGQFKSSPQMLFSAPGRTEIAGNHTDHQNGCVVCGSVDLDMIAFVSKNNTNEIHLFSEQFPPINVNLDSISKTPRQFGRSEALVKGVAYAFKERGFELSGFDGMMTSRIPSGMGLSSSAAFEILIGNIFNTLFCQDALSPVELAKIGRFAEGEFFGKPCGLMDQIGCSVGGCVFVDFKDPENPVISSISPDFRSAGLVPCVINTRAHHAGLTDEYAAVTNEMRSISEYFSKQKLRETDQDEFYNSVAILRKKYGDRAVLRAMHFFDENRRAKEEFKALEEGDFDLFLRLVNRSGLSSQTLLQNIHSQKNPKEQAATFTLALCKRLLGEKGAVRIHGGGFGGTVQAFVPTEDFDNFSDSINRIIGKDSCKKISLRPVGGCTIEL